MTENNRPGDTVPVNASAPKTEMGLRTVIREEIADVNPFEVPAGVKNGQIWMMGENGPEWVDPTPSNVRIEGVTISGGEKAANPNIAPPHVTGIHPNLAAALAAFQGEMPRITKGKIADVKARDGKQSYKYAYADLSDISPVAFPLLAKNGLSFTAKPTMMGERFVLDYALMHDGGTEVVDGIYPLPDPMQVGAQAIGSAITYARRYVFCSVTGISPEGDDDDGAKANDSGPASSVSTRAKASASRAKPKPEPIGPVEATEYWAADLAGVATESQLRDVWNRAEAANELGHVFAPAEREVVLVLASKYGLEPPPETEKVSTLINKIRGVLVNGPKLHVPPPEDDDDPKPAVEVDDTPAVLADETSDDDAVVEAPDWNKKAKTN